MGSDLFSPCKYCQGANFSYGDRRIFLPRQCAGARWAGSLAVGSVGWWPFFLGFRRSFDGRSLASQCS
eukprot:11223091-Lingulodinium_polyedra.AAC.1